MVPESVFELLEPLLPCVRKPVQYVGGEVNSVTKAWPECSPRWALLYPDAYEVGMSNQGLAILYELLNEQDGVLAERAFTPLADLAELMRRHEVPLFTLESHRPIRDFDLIGISLATELGYTNVLESLDLAGIPLRAADRSPADPVVVGGGHCGFNPEPLAEFLDVVVLGDGEEVALEIGALVRAWKVGGSSGGVGGRQQLLRQLGGLAGVYVPSCYDVEYLSDGRIGRVTPNEPGIPWRVGKRTVSDLDQWPYPKAPVVPLAEAIHERAAVEIFRGCLRGCRFCQAGMITRPVRERSADAVCELVESSLRQTGFHEAGLLSLSSADHSQIGQIAKSIADRHEGDQVSVSLPSTRLDAFNLGLAESLARNGRRSGLTFAPEGGSERLRQVINKRVSRSDVLSKISTAFAHGWRQVKLYFMCGLPTETDADARDIAILAGDVIKAGRRATGGRAVRCTISIGSFIPKAHTPFQWASQLDWETVDRRMGIIREQLRADGGTARAISLRCGSGKPAIVEGLLARGDRRVGRVIEAAWRDGGGFDGWREHFSFERWSRAAEKALAGTGVDIDWFTTRERTEDEILPWDHLTAGLDRAWLWGEWQDALDGVQTEDCREDLCFRCGVCEEFGVEMEIQRA